MRRLEFYSFTLWCYPWVPDDTERESYWVDLPANRYCDGRLAHRRLHDLLDVYVAMERAGYDGIVTNEHHASPGAFTPSPNLTAALIAARTERIRIAVVGNMTPAFLSPVRVAEEIAFLDVASGGRMICGLVRGTGMEYFVHPVDPSQARDRFWEAHDLIVRAWTAEEPFAWQGEHFHVPHVNPWPAPVQRPHPEVWIPGAGSTDTIERVARLGYRYMTLFAPRFFMKAQYDLYRQACAERGLPCGPEKLLASMPIYVAETDEAAHREAKPHIMWIFQRHLRIPPHIFFPPGFMEKDSFLRMLGARAKYGIKAPWELSYEALNDLGYVIVGSPSTVVEKLEAFVEEVGAGGVIGAGSAWGAMPKWMAMKNLELTAEEVFPRFRPAGGRPIWAEQPRPAPETRSESAAVIGRPRYVPRVRLTPGGDNVDAERAHLPAGSGSEEEQR